LCLGKDSSGELQSLNINPLGELIVTSSSVATQDVNIVNDSVGLATEQTLYDIQQDTIPINAQTFSIDSKISQGEQGTITGGSGGLQQMLLYGRDNSTDLHPIKITPQGDIDVEIADFVKGQNTMSQSFPVVISSDQTPVESKLVAEDYSASLQHVRCDMNGKLVVQVDGVRSNGSETIAIPDTTTGTSSTISMGTHKYIAFYGDTDNTNNTNIFIEYSQDQTNWYRGAGDNAKIIIVSATGNFYDEEHVTPPYVRLSRPNTSGSAETLELKYTLL